MTSAARALRCQLELLEQQLVRQSQSLETSIQNAEKQILHGNSESSEIKGAIENSKTMELSRNLVDNKARKLEEISLQGFEIIGNSAKTVSEAVISMEIEIWKETLASKSIKELGNQASNMVTQLENALHVCSSGNTENSAETTLPEFCGDPVKFREFMDIFTETVGKDNRKSDLEKLRLLLSCCKEEAKRSLEMIPVRAENYAWVLEHMKLRFGDRDLVTLSIKRKFEGIPQANGTTSSLWFTLNTAKALTMELENLGIKTENILYLSSMVLEKFPPQMKRDILEQQIVQRKNTLNDLFSLIEMDIHSKQIMEIERGINWNAKKQAHDNGKVLCALCKSKEHFFGNCDRYHSQQMRYDRVVKLRMCAICLSTFHKTRKCQQPGCYYCKGHHNTVLCTVKGKDGENQ